MFIMECIRRTYLCCLHGVNRLCAHSGHVAPSEGTQTRAHATPFATPTSDAETKSISSDEIRTLWPSAIRVDEGADGILYPVFALADFRHDYPVAAGAIV